MTTQEQIARLDNPQEFTKLCNTLFAAKYGPDFIVIDGARSDGGNDGYIKSEERLLAMYCPVKPEKQTDAKCLEKIRGDMAKAKALSDNRKYKITKWTFLTPEKLGNNVVSTMIEEGKKLGFECDYMEATHLAVMLSDHPSVYREFPWIHISKMEEKLDFLINHLIEKKELPKAENLPPPSSEAKSDSPDFKAAIALCEGLRTSESKTRLRALYYSTSDKAAKLQCVFGLLNWYAPINDKIEDQFEYCSAGLQLAGQLNAHGERARILAYKASLINDVFCQEDSYYAYYFKADGILGISIMSDEQKKRIVERLHSLQDSYENAFAEAQELAKKIGDYDLLADIYQTIGNSAGQRYIHISKFNPTRAGEEKSLSKRALMLAKDIYTAVKDEHKEGYALHNLANQINTFGEKQEALLLLEKSLKIGEKYSDQGLIGSGNALKKRIELGKIPDYVNGETWGDEPA